MFGSLQVEDDPSLLEIGNIWNAVPKAREWTPLDPIPGHIIVNIGGEHPRPPCLADSPIMLCDTASVRSDCNAFTVHADGLTFWSDGRYKSTYHRVRAPKDNDPRVRTFESLSTPCEK